MLTRLTIKKIALPKKNNKS